MIDIGARPACFETTYAAISGRPHLVRGSTPAESKASPLPTRKKSTWQASIMRAATSLSLASHLSTESLRPLIPPAALHHPTKASAVSKSSWSRPGCAEVPGSAIVPTRISPSVTPSAVAPLALPGPHTAFTSPKSPEPIFAAVVVAVPPFELPPDRLHPAASNTTTSSGIDQRALRTTKPPGIGDQAPTRGGRLILVTVAPGGQRGGRGGAPRVVPVQRPGSESVRSPNHGGASTGGFGNGVTSRSASRRVKPARSAGSRGGGARTSC